MKVRKHPKNAENLENLLDTPKYPTNLQTYPKKTKASRSHRRSPKFIENLQTPPKTFKNLPKASKADDGSYLGSPIHGNIFFNCATSTGIAAAPNAVTGEILDPLKNISLRRGSIGCRSIGSWN